MDRIVLTMNPLRPPKPGFLPGLVAALVNEGKEVRIAAEAQPEASFQTIPSNPEDVCHLRELTAWADLVIVIGGDGSILRTVQNMFPLLRPVMGVNSGRLGFLSHSADEDPVEIARIIRAEDFVISERSLLDAVVIRNGAEVNRVTALNEITVTRRKIARMIHVQATVHGQLLNNFHADGLIVATPTGSTAYSMSAGGPVVAPDASVLVLTPICPHALNNRSVVVGDSEAIELRAHPADEGDSVMFTADGETASLLEPGDVLRLQRAQAKLPLIMSAKNSFFETLREKLRWYGSNV